MVSQFISFDTSYCFTKQFGEVAQVDERATSKVRPINERSDGTDVQVIVG